MTWCDNSDIINLYFQEKYFNKLTPPTSTRRRGFLCLKIIMKKILIQFDGSNFYNKVKRMFPALHLTNFSYVELAKFVSKSDINEIVYYVGEIKKYPGNKKSQILYSNQQVVFTNLRNQKIDIKTGYLLLSNGKYHEKGVDVQIAVDIAYGAAKENYDICYLISSDTDLLPAIKTAQIEGKKIVYVGFKRYESRAMMNNCSSFLLLNKNDLEQFYESK